MNKIKNLLQFILVCNYYYIYFGNFFRFKTDLSFSFLYISVFLSVFSNIIK